MHQLRAGLALSQEVFLSTATPTPRERDLAVVVALLCLLGFAVAAPYATVKLPEVPAFIAVYQSVLVTGDVLTAVLLFGQFAMLRTSALLVLACGYLFAALMAVVHALSFPGLFTATGLLGATSQSTAWLYMFWHGGFPIAIIAYALLRRRDPPPAERRRAARWAIGWGVFVVLVLVLTLTLLATAGAPLLPTIMRGNGYTPAMNTVILSVWALCVVALAALWRRRVRAVLDLWLMVVLCAWLFDVALSAVLNGGRFDVGFYVGRINGLLAATFVLIVLLVETLALYGRLVSANEFLRDLANRDGLTGLFNRRLLNERLSGELSRAQREQSPIAVLMIDVDNFKAFNDTYGHLDGDDCLREVASAITRAVMRPGDFAARFGGEEFAVVLPNTDAAGAARVAEMIRQAIIDTAIPHGVSLTGVVTVSIGVGALWPDVMSRIEDVIGIADRALYEAKENGRNRVAMQVAAPNGPDRMPVC
jgi:diguanylate cyclase (GGDEF)-like protein